MAALHPPHTLPRVSPPSGPSSLGVLSGYCLKASPSWMAPSVPSYRSQILGTDLEDFAWVPSPFPGFSRLFPTCLNPSPSSPASPPAAGLSPIQIPQTGGWVLLRPTVPFIWGSSATPAAQALHYTSCYRMWEGVYPPFLRDPGALIPAALKVSQVFPGSGVGQSISRRPKLSL